MGRKPCCAKEGLNRGAWTNQEDKILVSYIKTHGEGKWRNLPKIAGLKRCGKSCRLRWLNYLRPDIKRGNISEDEEDLIIRLHKLLGNRWSLIAGRLPGRTDNEIKNYWNTNLGKRVHGQSSQSAKSKDKNPIIEPPKIGPLPPKSTPDAQVIRTKAARCTRTLFTPNQHHLKLEPKGTEIPSEILPRNGSFNDVTVSEGMQVGGDAMRQDGYSANLDGQLDDPAPFGGLMLDDWLSSECFEPEMTVDFQSLASFLHSEDEWN